MQAACDSCNYRRKTLQTGPGCDSPCSLPIVITVTFGLS